MGEHLGTTVLCRVLIVVAAPSECCLTKCSETQVKRVLLLYVRPPPPAPQLPPLENQIPSESACTSAGWPP